MSRPAVRVLTPPGTGAIATVEVRGTDAWATVRRRFTPASGRPVHETPIQNRVYFGTLGDESHADEVVVAIKAEDVVEVHCHGGRRVVQWLLELLGEEHPQPILRDVWAFLPHASTLRTASILLDQCHGAFDRAVDDILLSLESDPAEVGDRLVTLARFAPVGRHLVTPWKVVMAGKPNVGKSSLVNALAGFRRSVVSETPGTTRDVVTTLTAINGWPVELVDTAGLRKAVDPIESEGVGRARTAQSGADLVVWVLDGHAPFAPPGSDFVVVNKADLASGWDGSSLPAAHRVSAVTGEGIPELLAAISKQLIPTPPPAGAAVPYSPALADAVDAARTAYLSGNFRETHARLASCRTN